MAQNKTKETDIQVSDFIESFVENDSRKADAFQLVACMKKWSGCEPKMWGPSIIGFGSYHYQYQSGHEGDSPLIGFSPRKAAFSLYVHSDVEEQVVLLDNLGTYTKSKACIYVKKLSDIHLDVLEKICKSTIDYLNKHHICSCKHKN